LATPIQSYAGQDTVASKVSPTTAPPRSGSSGRAALASAGSEYVDTCTAVATSSHGASKKPPPSADGGAKPIECSTPSMPSTCSRTRSGSAARSSGLVTSSSTTGAGPGNFLATRSTSDIRP
jgi:hypothetical protein